MCENADLHSDAILSKTTGGVADTKMYFFLTLKTQIPRFSFILFMSQWQPNTEK